MLRKHRYMRVSRCKMCCTSMSSRMSARLISMSSVLATSHQAYLTKEALENIAETTCKNLNSYFTEGVAPNEVVFNR